MVDGTRRWKVGELAEATGLTVRTLHHFDDVGLLRPSERSPGGHRLYTDRDVRRLYQVLALRQLGVPLAEIKSSLDGDLSDLIRGQLVHVEQQIARWQQLRQHITSLRHRLADGPTIGQLLAAMEVMMKTSYFTPDQLTRLRARHNEVGQDAFQRWRASWAEIAAEFRAHLAAGTDPADPDVQAAGRWTRLMDDMTGGDRSILAAMYAKMDGQGPEAATLGTVSAEVWAYVKMALAVGHEPG